MPSSPPAPYERVPRPRSQARATYNRLARWYDLLEGWWERRPRLKGLEILAASPGERILEIGPGTGQAIAQLAERVGPTGRAVGLDIAEGMLARTSRRLARSAAASRTLLVQGDAVWLPFAARTLDAVFMSFVLELFDTPEIPRVLGECRRVLAPGGRLGVVALDLPERAGWPVRLYTWGHRRWPRLLDCRPVPVRSLLQDAGFRVPSQVSLAIWGLPVALTLGWNGEPGAGSG